MDYTIEAMTVDDFEEVTSMWRQTEGVGLSEADSRPNITIFLERNPGLSLVARNGNKEVVGAVLCGHDGRRGYLHHLAVAANYRRKGLGKSLVAKCLAELRRLGLQKCNIFIFENNAEGKAFWKRSGWGERGDLGVMQKLTENV
jgi:N-acetylglutamate synthase